MALFQKSVLKKYLGDINKELLQTSWQQFQLHFHNAAKQQNIRNANEVQYQEGFLRELFTDVLGYTLNPQPNFNLTTEYKNEKDSKKADGAILNGEQVVAVIELKGTDTTDLANVETQAFGYKNNQKGCTYIITSNFEKLRLYINDATEFEEFNLFTLSQERFALLYLCLQKDNLLAHVPLHIKQASLAAEENVTRKLYADYSTFKKKLYHNIVALNPQYDKLVLFKKTQKLLDRFLFIFFAEDRLLLPPNFTNKILTEYKEAKKLRFYQPLYQRYKLYFSDLNEGNELEGIFAYNGGLFAKDEVLETIIIDDDTLYQSCVTISNYDFDTEVDVNILGHIFEHSLNEIEELQAELEGTTIDKTKTKRKKDGVFYTPRYITKYIVENTVGSLCNAKKNELKIVDDEFTTEKRKANKKKLLTQIDAYRQWLLQLTICDPACGSGAFLNQALDFLLAEHRYVDELKAKLFGDSIVYSDVEKEILENNLFGVDINEEAVEIARLSLWLRTAHKGRKLNNLSDNIKCGNSLIDDLTVAGDKAFNWQKEFPQVFGEYVELPTKTIATTLQTIETIASNVETAEATIENTYDNNNSTERITNRDNTIVNTDFNIVNEPAVEYSNKKEIKKGFDVIIGNPPYVPAEYISRLDKTYLEKNYFSAFGRLNLYPIFYEKAVKISKPKSKIGFITPYTLLKNQYFINCRKYILENTFIDSIVDFKGVTVFPDAAVDAIILILEVSSISNNRINIIDGVTDFAEGLFRKKEISQSSFSERIDLSFEITENDLGIEKIKRDTVQLSEVVNFKQGIITGDNKKMLTDSPKSNTQKVITGSDFNRYLLSWNGQYIIYDEQLLHRPRKKEIFEVDVKILLRQTSSYPICALDTNQFYTLDTVHNGVIIDKSFDVKYLLCLLNSSLLRHLYVSRINEEGKVFAQVKIIYVDPLPIKKISPQQQLPFIEKANIMLAKNEELLKVQTSFLKLLQSKFENLQLNKKLNDWHSLTFGAFMKELEKQKIKLSLQEQADWMPFFEAEKEKALAILATIHATDNAIDAMVYALYNLTDEEIKIVEGA
jgi:type I restriction-modification system DNA methylase subunit